jgi:hypothetical protein
MSSDERLSANRFAFQLVEAIRNEFPSSKRADRLTVSDDCATRHYICHSLLGQHALTVALDTGDAGASAVSMLC